MPRIPIPFVGGAYTGKSLSINAQRCINCYPALDQQEGKSIISLDGIPGNVEWCDLGTSAGVRGLWTANSLLYAVSDAKLYEITTTPTATNKGAVGTGTGPVGFVHDDTHMIVSDPSADATYLYTFSTGAISAGGAPAGGQPAYLDTYALTIDAGTDTFWWCAVGNFASWPGLNYSTADSYPDTLVTLVVVDRQIWLMGTESIEVWYNDGSTPFSRIPGAFMDIGCAAAYSVGTYNDTIYWLTGGRKGQRRVLAVDQGYQPIPISTSQIDYQLSTYSTISDARAFCYEQEGHAFYVLTFPTEGKTWVYDITTNYWHERELYIAASDSSTRWRANCYAYFNGLHLVGDYSNGKIYKLDPTNYTDDTGVMRWIRQTQYAHDKRQRVRMDALDLDFDFGSTPVTTGQGSDPQVMLQVSTDGGKNFGNERWRSLGKIGEYDMRAIWRRLGSARTRSFRATITDPIPRRLIAAHADIQLVGR